MRKIIVSLATISLAFLLCFSLCSCNKQKSTNSDKDVVSETTIEESTTKIEYKTMDVIVGVDLNNSAVYSSARCLTEKVNACILSTEGEGADCIYTIEFFGHRFMSGWPEKRYKYVGKIINGTLNGEAELYIVDWNYYSDDTADELLYQGNFKDGKYDGDGVFYENKLEGNNEVYPAIEGTWVDGNLIKFTKYRLDDTKEGRELYQTGTVKNGIAYYSSDNSSYDWNNDVSDLPEYKSYESYMEEIEFGKEMRKEEVLTTAATSKATSIGTTKQEKARGGDGKCDICGKSPVTFIWDTEEYCKEHEANAKKYYYNQIEEMLDE